MGNFLSNHRLPSELSGEVQQLFEAIDADSSGDLTAEELARQLSWEQDRVKQLMSQCDQDHDGLISKAEFLAYFGKLCHDSGEPEARSVHLGESSNGETPAMCRRHKHDVALCTRRRGVEQLDVARGTVWL